ncbi:MAG: MurR/RpiR family transcriptional regulator [Synergistaceae bacterium]|nr:MurR/RpiR family transcriptional regulator [Synergistaceae bacterium]
MTMQELQEFIRERLDTFPAKARRVTEYLLTNSSEVAFHSITDVAERLGVSKAQLVRVARMLGFKGYAALKDLLKQVLLEQLSPSFIAEGFRDMDIPENLRRLEHANIDETLKHLTPDFIVRFCEAAKNAATLYCMGWGISAIVAEWFHTRFAELGMKVILARRGSLSLSEQTRALDDKDMLIVCELPSYVIEVTEAVEKIYKKGAFVVALTDSPAAPICRHSHLSLYVGDTSPTFGSSLLGPMFAVHVLTSVLAFNLGEEGRTALAAQEEGLHDQRVYYPAYGLRY